MANITRTISVNGWANVNMLLQTASSGYNGGLVRSLIIVSLNATAITVHVNDSATQPSTATDGVPVGSTASTAPSTILTLYDIDLTGVWVNTAAAQNITFLVNGNR